MDNATIGDLQDSRLDAIIDRHRSYWYNGEGDDAPSRRPLLQVNPPHVLEGSLESHYLEPPPPLDRARFRDSHEKIYAEHGLLRDDLFCSIHTGIPSEVLVGCRVVQRAGTHWAENCLKDWGQLDDYRIRDAPWHQSLLDNTKRAVDAIDSDKYPFCCMAFRGAVDMVEAMMGGERLCTAVVDNPRELKNLLARITDITIETAVAHSALIPTYKGGQFNSYGIWTPGRTTTFTLDGGCLFSPACYEEFFLPCDQRLCAALDTPFVHLHAAARQHFSAWAEIDNLGLQCVIDQAWMPEGENNPIGPQLPELLPDFKAIRGRKSLMLYGYWDEEAIDLASTELDPVGCAITGMVLDPAAIRRRYIGAAA
ncbi:MAG: hypothetical protein QGH25_00945 [Candidatus Latescibacteria bacterium]|nr:hypothetical protein [Candidatus Latescibacterota bacterium]